MNKLLLSLNILFVAFHLHSATIRISDDSPIRYEEITLPRSCFLNASGYKEAYEAEMIMKDRKGFARLMRVDITEVTGHAICIFEYRGRYKCYDNLQGTFDLGEFNKVPTTEEILKKLPKNYSNGAWIKQ